MKRTILYIYLLALLLPADFSCIRQDTPTGEHAALFYRDEPKFRQLVEVLQADPVSHKRWGHTVFWKAFSNHTKRRLQQLGITHVRLYAGGRHMDLKTNWRVAHPVYLCYSEAGGHPSSHGSLTIRHQLNASWALYKKPTPKGP